MARVIATRPHHKSAPRQPVLTVSSAAFAAAEKLRRLGAPAEWIGPDRWRVHGREMGPREIVAVAGLRAVEPREYDADRDRTMSYYLAVRVLRARLEDERERAPRPSP